MASRELFKTHPTPSPVAPRLTPIPAVVERQLPAADTLNSALGVAYSTKAEHALAQYAVTGCLNHTFYASAGEQLSTVKDLAREVSPEFLAKTAVYAREVGSMKDMPALLLAILSTRDKDLFGRAFPRVIDNEKMLRNFVQIMRSGETGRRSLASQPTRLIREWLDSRTDDQLFKGSVGQKPSLADVIKLVHPEPKTPSREALYKYLLGRPYNEEALPPLVRHYEEFKRGERKDVPNVPFQMLDSLKLDTSGWTDIARTAGWTMTRMNLNTFQRHGVFENPEMVEIVANRIANPDLVRKSGAFPYQLLAAYKNVSPEMPHAIVDALQAAMEIATENVPVFGGKTVVCPDVSGSMKDPVTGYRTGSTTKVRCIDAAAVTAASIIRSNPTAEVLPFETKVVEVRVNSRDSIVTNAERLAAVGGGGTTISAPIRHLNERGARADLVVLVSDNESWADPRSPRSTALAHEWAAFKIRNPNARLVCIDITPNRTAQAQDREDVLNIGGFSDEIFKAIRSFAEGELREGHWSGIIEEVKL